jgi:AcrR family transcriptional regulator
MRLNPIPSSTEPLHTKQRILDVAERLFAEHGFEQTSLRTLTAEAGVNLAAVHYHFASKEGLFEAVVQRLVEPLNVERLSRLEALEAQGQPSLEALIESFVAPPLRLCGEDPQRGQVAPRLLGRTMGSPDQDSTELLLRLFGTVIDRYLDAFSRALPGHSRKDVLWRMFFMVGVMVQTLSCGHHLQQVSHGACNPVDPDETIPRVVAFVAAGFRAALPAEEPRS